MQLCFTISSDSEKHRVGDCFHAIEKKRNQISNLNASCFSSGASDQWTYVPNATIIVPEGM